MCDTGVYINQKVKLKSFLILVPTSEEHLRELDDTITLDRCSGEINTSIKAVVIR